MGFSWIPREAPLRGPQPAVPFRHFEAAAEPSDFLPASLREPLGEGRFRQRVACALAGEDRDRRNPPRDELTRPALDAEHRPASLDRNWGIAARKSSVRRQRQNEPAALRQPVEPNVDGSRRAGVDIDQIGSLERHDGAVPADDVDIGI